jgi:hypothetical protein
MRFLQRFTTDETLTQIQRWAHYLIVAFSLAALFIGVNLRDSTLNATTLYSNVQAGIEAEYPRNWLLDEEGDYVFRVRDMSQIGFKTTMQVTTRPVSGETTERNILDSLILNRAQILDGYRVIAIDPFTLPDESTAVQMISGFIAAEPNPFLQSVPISIETIDIITIQRGQAIIITFQSDAQFFEQNLPIFQQFLASLEF